MKPKTTLILLVIAVVIGAFVWYDAKYLDPTDKVKEQEKRVLPKLKPDDVARLELRNTNGVIVVERAGDKWDMKQPFAVRANKPNINSILSDLEFLDAERVITPKELQEAQVGLADYGLDKPQIEVTFTLKDKPDKPRTLKMGSASQVGDNLYVMVDGRENVYLVGKSLLGRLNKSVDDLRDRAVVDVETGQLTRLEIKSGNRQIELTHAEAGEAGTETWRISRPIQARADREKVGAIARQLSDLEVDTFVTEEPKDLKLYGLDDAPHEVSVFTKGSDGARIVLFGVSPTNDTEKVYAKRKSANSIFLVKKDFTTNLVLQVNDLRDRKLAEFDTEQVRRVELEVGGHALKLARARDDWEIAEPAKFKAEQDACGDLVHLVADVEIKEFVADVVTDLATYGLDKPFAQITLHKAAGAAVESPKAESASTNAAPATTTPAAATEPAPIVTVQVGKVDPTKGIVYVKRVDEPFVYGAETNFLADLPKGLLDLRNRTILDVDADSVSKIEIARGASKFVTDRVFVKNESGVESREWKLVSPAQGVLDVDAVVDAVAALSDLKAEKLVADNPSNLAEYGLDQPALTATFVTAATTNAPELTYVLLVGKEGADKRHCAQLKGNPLVFELDETTFDQISKDFVGKPEEKPLSKPEVPASTVTNPPPAAATPPPPAAASPPAAK